MIRMIRILKSFSPLIWYPWYMCDQRGVTLQVTVFGDCPIIPPARSKVERARPGELAGFSADSARPDISLSLSCRELISPVTSPVQISETNVSNDILIVKHFVGLSGLTTSLEKTLGAAGNSLLELTEYFCKWLLQSVMWATLPPPQLDTVWREKSVITRLGAEWHKCDTWCYTLVCCIVYIHSQFIMKDQANKWLLRMEHFCFHFRRKQSIWDLGQWPVTWTRL